MASRTLNVQDRFPAGTSVKAIKASNWATFQLPPTADQGSADDTKTVAADGTLTFTTLADGTAYFATATVSGQYRVVGFNTPALGAVDIAYAGIHAWQTINPTSSFKFDAAAANTWLGNGVTAVSGNAGQFVFYFDPADYAISGYSTELRLTWSCLTNATAPAATFTCGLYPVTAVAGGAAVVSVTLGAVLAGTVVFASPLANTENYQAGAAFVAPAAGYYVPAVAISPAMAASSSVALRSLIQVRST